MKQNNVMPGDRALIVSSRRPENIGIVVDVIRPYTGGPIAGAALGDYVLSRGEVSWVVESLGRKIAKEGIQTGAIYLEQITAMSDWCLRPLRDGDGVDEMVSRVGRAPVSQSSPAREMSHG